jgi:hypothetical protein
MPVLLLYYTASGAGIEVSDSNGRQKMAAWRHTILPSVNHGMFQELLFLRAFRIRTCTYCPAYTHGTTSHYTHMS